MKTVAVIVASGDGARLGIPEANLEYEKGRSFLKWLSSTFSKAGCAGTIGVIRSGAEAIKERHPDAVLVEGDGEGLTRAGIKAALDEGAEAIVLHAVERPAVRSSTVDKLLKSMDGADGVVPDFEGAPGQPVILWREAAERLLRMEGDLPLASIVQKLELRRVATRDPGVLVNIDTPEMYERLLGKKPTPAPLPKKRGRKADA
ncbi:MAG: NTP transferase domain-containing protein [Myxococcaceae bacterium]|nr:NTP transferase domain-containing protein [Myxococcaceae bacterium]